MENRLDSRRGRGKGYVPKPETLALLKVSGNSINGLGETAARQASPFFWHPPEQHPYGELQNVARQSSRRCPGAAPAFMAAYNHPELIPVVNGPVTAKAEEHAAEATEFALQHEADATGIAAMDPLYIFDGYEINEPWVIILALAHNYERLKQVPSDETNGIGVTDVGEQYARGTRASFALPTGSGRAATVPVHGPVRPQAPCCSFPLPLLQGLANSESTAP